MTEQLTGFLDLVTTSRTSGSEHATGQLSSGSADDEAAVSVTGSGAYDSSIDSNSNLKSSKRDITSDLRETYFGVVDLHLLCPSNV
ncbi:unnamed protein product [Protopolystoma xenopodis]|uniref:Uncharacterized protein n=1 Tax=Protopolystoma xenopodis TaxID=117903 RepID=A0A448X903_9PLAT|nr:unnamed protein product [Protopolystoma xenopodis]